MGRISMGLVAVVALLATACGGGGGGVTQLTRTGPVTTTATAPANLAPTAAQKVVSNPVKNNKPIITHDVIVPVSLTCPKAHATMGCATQPAGALPPSAPIGDPPAGAKFPDVSSYQGHPNWSEALHSGIYGAVAKLGEYSLDPDVGYNVSAFRQLHMRWSVYLFVRPLGCSTEVNNALTWLRDIGGPSTSGPPLILDEEVPGLAGYATCIDQGIYNVYHRHVAVYTAPGTWSGGSGGSLDVWIASYGPMSPPSCPWGCHVAAFQYTDGAYGYPTPIPGIGNGDVSVSYSLLGQVAPVKPPKPKVVCWGKGSTPKSTACLAIEKQAAGYWHKYLPFAAGVKRHTAEANKAKGVIASLELNKASVYQTYKGPGLGYINAELARSKKWAGHYYTLWQKLVEAHKV